MSSCVKLSQIVFFFPLSPPQLFQVFLAPTTRLSAGITFALGNKTQSVMGLWTVLMEVMKAAAVSPSQMFIFLNFELFTQ